MTVLLIDGVGRKRVYEIVRPIHEILIPIPRQLSTRLGDINKPPTYSSYEIARFVRTDELSYPPVYRQAITDYWRGAARAGAVTPG